MGRYISEPGVKCTARSQGTVDCTGNDNLDSNEKDPKPRETAGSHHEEKNSMRAFVTSTECPSVSSRIKLWVPPSMTCT